MLPSVMRPYKDRCVCVLESMYCVFTYMRIAEMKQRHIAEMVGVAVVCVDVTSLSDPGSSHGHHAGAARHLQKSRGS